MNRILAPVFLLFFPGAALAGPPASVEDLAWLAGSWAGPGIDGQPAGESWSAPAGGQMAGHFYQLSADGDVMFYELFAIRPDGEGSLEMRLKHFESDLAGWEGQSGSDSLEWQLEEIGPGRARFGAVTYELSGDDVLKVTVAMRHDDGSTGELGFELTRQ